VRRLGGALAAVFAIARSRQEMYRRMQLHAAARTRARTRAREAADKLHACERERDRLQSEAREADQRARLLEAERDVYKAQLELLTAHTHKYLAVQMAEAAVAHARREQAPLVALDSDRDLAQD